MGIKYISYLKYCSGRLFLNNDKMQYYLWLGILKIMEILNSNVFRNFTKKCIKIF